MCERCGKSNLTSHHRCADCQMWVGGCCLVQTQPANLCKACARVRKRWDELPDAHYGTGHVGEV